MTTLILNIAVGLTALIVTVILTQKIRKSRREEQKYKRPVDLAFEAFKAHTKNKEAGR